MEALLTNNSRGRLGWILTLAVLFFFWKPSLHAQKYSKSDRQNAEAILRVVSNDVQKYYYDPKLHGLNWDTKVSEAKENIDKADSLNGAISEIAALLDSLNDSHTFFVPPPRTYVHDYGFATEMVGDHCFVIRVRPGSDAEKKNLKPGNEILAINGHRTSRAISWKMQYLYDVLQPQQGLQLLVKDDTGQQQIEVLTKFRVATDVKYETHQGINQLVRDRENEEHRMRARMVEIGDEFFAVKLPEFAYSAVEVDSIVSKMKKHKAAVLDLRGNPGGSEDTLIRLLGSMFENDLKIYDRVGRDFEKSVTAPGRHKDAFTGRLIVLVDSGSASASELFARVIQLQRRGFVIGDRTEGSVMESIRYPHEFYLNSASYYGTSITHANLMMSDGNSLEHVGVDPDINILPTSSDIASNRDPVLAKAASILGVKLTPEQAGAMFPYEEGSKE